jgi:uncharacterized membrane protein YcgQ (UPF0703/DUF1980 family)
MALGSCVYESRLHFCRRGKPGCSKPEADTWIEMEGVITRRNLSGANDIKSIFHIDGETPNNDIPYFEVSRLKIIPAPHDPYFYP